MRFTLSLRTFPNVAFKTISVVVLLTMALYRPFKKDRLAFPVLIVYFDVVYVQPRI